jgi:hypothetical protein
MSSSGQPQVAAHLLVVAAFGKLGGSAGIDVGEEVGALVAGLCQIISRWGRCRPKTIYRAARKVRSVGAAGLRGGLRAATQLIFVRRRPVLKMRKDNLTPRLEVNKAGVCRNPDVRPIPCPHRYIARAAYASITVTVFGPARRVCLDR